MFTPIGAGFFSVSITKLTVKEYLFMEIINSTRKKRLKKKIADECENLSRFLKSRKILHSLANTKNKQSKNSLIILNIKINKYLYYYSCCADR